MGSSDFFKYLLIAIALTVAFFFFFNLFLPLGPYVDLLGGSLVMFIGMSIIAYWLGNKSISSGGATYVGLVMVNVILKMVASFALVAVYARLKEPDDRFFLIPFLITYLVFTVYEVYFMSAQARETK